jgi:CBS domain-containing protein
MITVAGIMAKKGKLVYSLTSDDTVFAALEMMKEKTVRSIVVIEDDQLLGIVSERDCALKVLLPSKSAKEVKLDKVMTKQVVTVGVNDTLERCMHEMASKNIRHLPVMDHGKVIGMVSIGDIVKEIMGQQEEHIKYLESYIKGHSGSYY